MIRAARRSGRTLMIAQCIRFWPQYETIQRLIAEGRIGAVRFAFLRRIASPPQYSSGGWLMDGSRSGGAIFDLHVHDVDFAHVLMGVPDTVYARGTRGPSGEIDHVLATYGYADGRYALLEGGWVFHPPWPFDMSITVHGERGTLFWSMPRGPEVLLYAGAAEPETFPHDDQTGWMRELDYFIDCVLSGTPVQRCTPDSSRTSIALTLLERQSIDSGRLITTPADLRPGAH
jgi:predicted dehydrogenase